MADETEKQIDEGNLRIHELVDLQGTKSSKGKGLHTLFNAVAQSAMVPLNRDPQKDMPMMILKHRWMRNRNLVAGVTTVSFDSDGIARVPDVGNNRLDVEQLMRQYPNLIEMVGDENVAPSEAPETPVEAKEAPKAPEAPEAVEAAPEAAEAAPEATEEAEAEEEPTAEDGEEIPTKRPVKKKAPPKRKK